MYYNDENNFDNSHVQPENDISGFNHKEANVFRASSSRDGCYKHSSWDPITERNTIASFESFGDPIYLSELYQPLSFINLGHLYVRSNFTPADLQITNPEIDVGVDINSGVSNGHEDDMETRRYENENENEQFNTQIDESQVIDNATKDFENLCKQANKDNETEQFNTEIHKSQVLCVVSNNYGDSNGQVHRGDETGKSKRKGSEVSEESETFGDEDLENIKVTKKNKSLVDGNGLLGINDTNQLENGDENVTWLQRPADFLSEAPLWRLLWRYGVQYIEKMHEKREDYIGRLRLLINTEKVKKQSNKFAPLRDYQIVSLDGRVWLEKDISDQVKVHKDRDKETKKTACVSLLCEKCVFKKHKHNPVKLFEHILKLMGVKYRCMYCGLFFYSRKEVLQHTEKKKGKKKGKKGNQNDTEPSFCPAIRLGVTYKIQPAKIDFENRFLDWTRMLIKNIKLDNYLPSQSMEMLIEQVKNEIDFNFVDLFKAMEKIGPPNKKYLVEMKNDDYYNIVYWTQNSFNTDPRKSAMFKIVEKNEIEAITIQQLERIKSQTLDKHNDVCVYKRCWCGALYRAPDKKTLLQHVLTSNILIVCVGCKIGFTDFHYFEQHLTQLGCFLLRMDDTT